ncbi:MAG: hypothetical protein RTV31_09375 [Candidatus Thorarchaeota archaeon]
MLKEPPDFIGNILAKLINRQIQNPSMKEKMKSWKMSVILETDFYPVSIIFDQDITAFAEVVENPTLVFTMDFGTIIKLVEQETTMIRAMIGGSIKVKGFFRNLRSVYRFYSLMNSILKG